MTIGVAKPNADELNDVEHFFINSHSIHEEVSAGVFERYALEKAEQIFAARPQLVMAGGTGLYIKAFCEGIDQIPGVPAIIRDELNRRYEAEGIEWLKAELSKSDPLYFASGEIHNPHRMLRALEVKLASGKSIKNYQTNQKTNRDFKIIKIGIGVDRQELYNNINNRVHVMIEQGLLDEVKSLYEFRNLKALQTVGYAELFEYLDGKRELAEAIEEIQKNTRHYSKRQMTWFRKDEAIHWFHPSDYSGIFDYIRKKMSE